MAGTNERKARTPVDELSAAERELRAMKKIGQLLEGLAPAERSRALSWAVDHYGEPGTTYTKDVG